MDADKVDIPYEGGIDNYINILYDFKAENSLRKIFAQSEYSVTMDFVRFCRGIALIKQREFRDNKINDILNDK